MTQSPEQLYLESRIYTATPEELVHILYETALEATLRGIEAVEAGDIETRARAITKASSCVMELAGSLNVEAGGELGIRLAVLYEYLLHELLEANVHQSAAPLRDCERVLRSLLEGWTAAIAQLEPNPAQPATTSASEPIAAPSTPHPSPTPPAAPFMVPAAASFGVDSDDPDAFDIESLEPAAHSWCG
ncbi:MAG: flagellar export chaperone FliS [Bryobacterales bacterium]|nr:flagellar export chaperone FliS [Bryobacterales bacterium]